MIMNFGVAARRFWYLQFREVLRECALWQIRARDKGRSALSHYGKLEPHHGQRKAVAKFVDPQREGTHRRWLAQGKFAICFFRSEDVEIGKRQGLPIDSMEANWKEGSGLVSQSGNLAMLKNAPHPNAAKVFINWLLSREGQIELQRVLAKVQPAESRRNDIPKDDVPSDVRRKPGEKYMDLDSRPEWSDMEPVRKLLNDTVKEAKK